MTRPRGVIRVPALRRVHAALTALAFVLAGTIGLVHEATTTHVRCAEHGELTDVDLGGHPPGLAAATDHTVSEDRSTGADRGHEHCVLGCAAQLWTVPSPVAVVATVVPETGVAFVVVPADAAPRVELYRTAPKTSPPA